MASIHGNNPGVESGDEFSAAQETLVKSIANLSLQNGDIIYYNNGAFQRLAIGSNTHILNLSSGIPAWKAEPSRTQFTAYGVGTAYTLTATPALVDLGTTDPSITITSAGTYLMFSRCKIDYSGATFAASKIITAKLRRTNNTAADLTGAIATFGTDIVTTLTATATALSLPPVLYTTANTDDNIQLFGSVAELPAAGNVTITEAEVVAVKLY